MKESHPKEIKMTRTTKAKENSLNEKIQIISSENAQNYQETTIKEPSLEDHGVIATNVMSHSDELTYTNNTTTIFPRFPDTLPYVYTRCHSTQRFPTLPSPSFYARRTARMSVIPVLEPGLAERARISAINLDDYQDDPESPPPSRLSSHQIAAYQKMISKTDFT
ncbi:hypothetical protein Tco_0779773 [Tanacetum coccineum]